jgi:tetratricopeptide (TPR) repeat protein
LQSLKIAVLANVAVCYSKTNRPFYSQLFYERAMQARCGDLTNLFDPFAVAQYSTNCISIGNLKKGKQLADQALVESRRVKRDDIVGVCYLNYAEINRLRKNHQDALAFYDKALTTFVDYHKIDKGQNKLYLRALLQKAICLFEAKRFNECYQTINKGASMAKDANDFLLMFESLEHLMNLQNEASETYIKDVAIPGIMKISYEKALFFCDKLEAHYKKKRSTMKALMIAAISRDIYKTWQMSDEMATINEWSL